MTRQTARREGGVRARGLRLSGVLSLAAVACAPAATAFGHAGKSGELGVTGVPEKRLRAFEERVLGSEHAAEHARSRGAVRRRLAREARARRRLWELPAAERRRVLRARAARAPAARRTLRAQAAQAGAESEVGRWNPTATPLPVMAIHVAMLPTGKVLMFAYPKNPNPRFGDPTAPNTAMAYLWNPSSNTFKRVDPPNFIDPVDGVSKPANIWCGAQSLLSDGRVLVTGGNLDYQPDWKGLNKVFTFNPFNETWREQPSMRHGRWYPTNVLLPDGRTLIMSGYDETPADGQKYNLDVERFTPSPDMDGVGTMQLLGQRAPGRSGSTNTPPNGGLYPHTWVMPSGRVMVGGPFLEDTWLFNRPGADLSWSDVPDMPRDRVWGTGVGLPGGTGGSTRYMQLGGNFPNFSVSNPTDLAVRTTAVFDESSSGAGWVPSAHSMNVGRGHHNTVLLPDGAMVTIGGGVGIRDGNQWAADDAQRQVELWDPSAGAWRLGPPQAEKRAYHSTALLLPDGRVMSAGDDYNGGIDRDTAEIYEPPYLFKGARPTISSAPANVSYGQAFTIGTPDANVTKAMLIALGATTHANDMNQRAVPLRLTAATGGVALTAPSSGTVAPPGYYMLFLLNDRGVPSVARFVRLGGTSVPAPPADLARNRPASASSVETAAFTPEKANDGTSTTRWSARQGSDGEWWQVDLGVARTIESVKLDWEDAYMSRYRIDTSLDGAVFSPAADVTISSKGVHTTTFAQRSARYVRITGIKRATSWGMSLWDVNVYAPAGAPAPTPTPTPTPPPPPPPPPGSSYATTVLDTPGLSSYWRFGEASGTMATAAKGLVTGSYGVGVRLGQVGLINGDADTAGVFDGSGSALVRFGDVYDFTGNTKFSLEAWVKPTTVDANARRIFAKDWANAAGVQGWYLINSSARLSFARLRDGVYESFSVQPLAAGGRYHVVFTYDGATMRLYVNGTLRGASASGAALLDGTVPFTVGAKATGGVNWAGTIDEPAIYFGTVLSAADVQSHFAAGG